MAEGGSSLIGAAEYEAIEAAVMETARGRWFLAEFARRNRTADTAVLLEAIGRLEKAVAGERRAQGAERIRFDLSEMAKAIGRMKKEVASLRPDDAEGGPLLAASEALDGIVRTAERATSDILEAAERIQEAAWTLREGGAGSDLCDALDHHATGIYTACSFQDLTAQRTAKVVDALRYLEGRIDAMIDVWGGAEPAAEAEPPPVLQLVESVDLSQSEVNDVIVEADILELDPVTLASVEAAAPATADFAHDGAMSEQTDELEEEPARPAGTADTVIDGHLDAPTPRGVRVDALAAIDALPTREKLRRFT